MSHTPKLATVNKSKIVAGSRIDTAFIFNLNLVNVAPEKAVSKLSMTANLVMRKTPVNRFSLTMGLRKCEIKELNSTPEQSDRLLKPLI